MKGINIEKGRIHEKVHLFDNLVFNVPGHFILKNEVKIFLTQTEFNLLLFFVENANTLIYVSEIVEYLNDKSHGVYTEQNVYVFIRRLRTKIEDNPRDPAVLLNLRPGYILSV